MGTKDFLRNAVSLLERIGNSPELKSWCRHYSVYAPPQDHALLEAELLSFIDQTYRESLVIVNYGQVIEKWELHDQDIASVSPEWLSVQPYICVLASITWHFRRDHFQNGALISESIASGALLRLFQRLHELCSWPSVATTLQTLYCEDCQSIPNDSGVYQILVPSGMSIHFTEQQYNRFAPLYTAEKLADKYPADDVTSFAFSKEGRQAAQQINNNSALLSVRLDIKFETDSYKISSDSIPALVEFAETAKVLNGVYIQIEGNTAKVDGDDGKDFSFKRARSVAKYLQALGIDSRRFIIIGNGDSKPIDTNLTEEGKANNRRTEVFFKTIGY